MRLLLVILSAKIIAGTNVVRRVLLAELNDYDKTIICNGCKPAWLAKFIPAKLEKVLSAIWDLDFKAACNQHDVDYYFGKTNKDKKQADKAFYKAMKAAIKKQGHGWWNRWFYYYKAWQYYKLVAKFGKSAFFEHNADILPSYSPFLNKDIRKSGKQCVWVGSQKRWYFRTEAKTRGLI